jgi:polysaccharide export outer membrane protein
MNVLFSTALLVGLLPASIGIAAQQSVTNPPAGATTDPAQAQPAAPPQAPAALAAPATAGPNVPPEVTASYVVGPDDNIRVDVWHEPTLSGSFPVRPDGMISLALVGDIMAAGRTPMDLANDLTIRLKKYITDPTVTVSVVAVNSKRVFMLGEIAHIGPIPLTSTLTPLQAISAAGGLSQYANKSKIYILRVENGKKKKIPFNYKKAIKDGDLQGVTLLPGDTIVVP